MDTVLLLLLLLLATIVCDEYDKAKYAQVVMIVIIYDYDDAITQS
jgi:hypothetical protein